MALVSWDSVCQLRSHGGLGLRSLRNHNTSFIMKFGFNIVSNSNAFWVRVLRSKYGVQSDFMRPYQGGEVFSYEGRSLMYSLLSVRIYFVLLEMVTKDGEWNLDFF